MDNAQKDFVTQQMLGTWKFADENDSLFIIISPLQISVDLNGQQEEFDNNAHWLDDHHLGFWNRYFIFDATENTLVFGKHNVPIMVGNYEWIKTLDRIAE